MKIYSYADKKNIVGEKILRLRRKKGLTQRALSEQLQLRGYEFSDLTILRIENGTRSVADFEIVIFAEYFHVSYRELMED